MDQEIINLKQGLIAESDGLLEQGNGYRKKMNEIKGEIVAAEQAMKDARGNYEKFMDQGDRILAEESFDKIKPLREKAARLYRELVEMESIIPEWRDGWTELLRKMGELRTLVNEAFKKAEKERHEIASLTRGAFEGPSPADKFGKDLQNCIGQLKQEYYE